MKIKKLLRIATSLLIFSNVMASDPSDDINNIIKVVSKDMQNTCKEELYKPAINNFLISINKDFSKEKIKRLEGIISNLEHIKHYSSQRKMFLEHKNEILKQETLLTRLRNINCKNDCKELKLAISGVQLALNTFRDKQNKIITNINKHRYSLRSILDDPTRLSTLIRLKNNPPHKKWRYRAANTSERSLSRDIIRLQEKIEQFPREITSIEPLHELSNEVRIYLGFGSTALYNISTKRITKISLDRVKDIPVNENYTIPVTAANIRPFFNDKKRPDMEICLDYYNDDIMKAFKENVSLSLINGRVLLNATPVSIYDSFNEKSFISHNLTTPFYDFQSLPR